MLGQVLSDNGVSLIFILSSVISLFLVLYAPHAVKRYGNVKYLAVVLVLSIMLLLFIGSVNPGVATVLLFTLYFSLNSLIYYGFDVFLERFTRMGSTGNTRGAYLTLGNLAWIGAPALVGYLTANSNFSIVYILAAVALAVTLGIVLTAERKYHDLPYGPTTFKSIVRALRNNSDIRDIVVIQTLLQFFYVWMVIYVPLYLSQTLGFGWETIGTILSIMLIPFIIFPYPVGKMIDKYSNEREVIFFAFLVIAFATIFFAQLNVASMLAIALALFLTRVGASIAEVSIESYFFKKVQGRDIELVSAFRNATPVAYIIAPVFAIIAISFGNYQTLFTTLGVIMSMTALFALFLHDIRKKR